MEPPKVNIKIHPQYIDLHIHMQYNTELISFCISFCLSVQLHGLSHSTWLRLGRWRGTVGSKIKTMGLIRGEYSIDSQ